MLFKIKRYLAIGLLLVMGVYSVPKELLHELHHHTDTVDSPFTSNNTREISTKHIHCDVFEFNGPVLFYSFQIFTFSVDFTPYIYSPDLSTKDYFQYFTPDNLQRGPPSFIVG
jgi:hypothetical protein